MEEEGEKTQIEREVRWVKIIDDAHLIQS
ncbi:uncharacterized protein G2W53_017859 [Senna tora]|uniref:Uncharacterized protein n=1 Tax=Senna tora TaxID=362788 RepID=A0A834TR06_9FABA|nr:uncharacterized protein G2W53_017859 [Senna tora]